MESVTYLDTLQSRQVSNFDTNSICEGTCTTQSLNPSLVTTSQQNKD